MSELLVGNFRVGQRGDTRLVGSIANQPFAQLGARCRLAAGQHERGVTEIHKRDLTAALDPPATSKPSRQTRLAPVGHFRGRDLRRHACTVMEDSLQGEALAPCRATVPHLWHNHGMSRVRVSTTVDSDLLTEARTLHRGTTDAALLDEALGAFVARHRAAEVDAAYANAYDAHPLDEPDEWGDLASFRSAAGAT